MNPRLRAVCDLVVGEMREYVGLHDSYDGVVQDLSPAGVAAGLARLGDGPAETDGHDEAQLTAYETGLRTSLGLLEEYRRNPLYHLSNLDVACYDREYAPAEERAEANRRHLAAWPGGDRRRHRGARPGPRPRRPSPVPGRAGLAEGVDNDDAALAAQALAGPRRARRRDRASGRRRSVPVLLAR